MVTFTIVYLICSLFLTGYLIAGNVSFLKWFIDASILLCLIIAVDWVMEGPVREFTKIYGQASPINFPPKEESVPLGIAKTPALVSSPKPIIEKKPKNLTKPAATFTIDALYPSRILEDEIAAATGLIFGKSDNHFLIKVDHTGHLRQNKRDANYHYYSGGNLKISINGRTCCCFGAIKVPSTSYPGNSLHIEEEKLSTAIEEIVTRNKDFIIEKIKGCIL